MKLEDILKKQGEIYKNLTSNKTIKKFNDEIIQKEPIYTFGIPTQSDVKDEKYKKALLSKELKGKLDTWSYWPTSTTFLHNHVVGALRNGEEDVFKAEEAYKNGKKVGKKAKKLLNPKQVLQIYLDGIKRYRSNLEEVINSPWKNVIDKETWTERTEDINLKYDNKRKLADIVKVEVCNLSQKPFAKGFKYTWNPYKLALYELQELEKDLKQAFNSSSNPAEQIHKIWEVVDRYEHSADKQLIEHIKYYNFGKEPWLIENEEGTEANMLREENHKIGEKSDIYIRFDEVYIEVRNPNASSSMISIAFRQSFIDENYKYDSTGLSGRIHIRDLILKKANEKGFVIINGVKYKAVKKQDEISSYAADGITCQTTVNMLGKPVSYGDAAGFHKMPPEEWIVEEIKLVEEFRKGNIGIADEIFKKYKGFGSRGGITTHKEKLENLKYALRRY